ncbi:MAG: IMP dehydrogenase [Sedimentisphaerales bacterium]|nr:IMP dehydrogenase [Sedimentisphaerales bacterium]
MSDKIIGKAITFDDVLLVPAYSDLLPRDVDTSTSLTRDIRINIPLISSPMDTVTESALAIAIAQEGGIGVIHKNLSIEEQVIEVEKVKRSENGVILDPVTLGPDDTAVTARNLMTRLNISGIPVLDKADKLIGILTRRDMAFLENENQSVATLMTSSNLVTGPAGTTLTQAQDILNRHKVEKLLLVHDDGTIAGLITMRDIERVQQYPKASKDSRGRLRVGASVSVMDFERVEQLIAKDVDVITVDSAHGHSKNVIETVREIKKNWDIQIIAGNVATYDGAAALAKAGADAVRVGIGPGSICTTRVVSGVGVPQVTAIMECARAGEEFGIPVIADGGVRQSGDIVKAIAAGASAVMLGSLFAGLEESPGELIIFQGRQFKTYRGMGSMGAMVKGGGARYGQNTKQADKLVPEGVEGRVPYRGKLSGFVYQMVGGLRAGMGYCGAHNIDQLRKNTRFIEISAATVRENHPHDISITHEAPNYFSGDAKN